MHLIGGPSGVSRCVLHLTDREPRQRPSMNPLDFLEPGELLQFLHRRKTEISCIQRPLTFLNQLRDHDLIPEERYKKMSRMKSKDNLQRAFYEFLDWLEKERPTCIKEFWGCVFKETIIEHYPVLRLLRNSLMDGSFHFDIQPLSVEKDGAGERKRKVLSEEEEEDEVEDSKEKKVNSVKKKRKRRRRSICDGDDEEQAGPSCQSTPARSKKSKKIHFYSPLKKGEKSEIWTWPLYKSQLPVTCGDKEGKLHRGRMAKGERCIVVNKQWFNPGEFERFAGKGGFQDWKSSIRCKDTPLGKLIKEGHLETGSFKRGCKKTKKTLFPPDHLNTESEEEEDDEEDDENEDEDEECGMDRDDEVSSSQSEPNSPDFTGEDGATGEQTEQQPKPSQDSDNRVFKVTCGSLTGTLHMKRLGSGTRGKSIRTDMSWLTPVEFVEQAACQGDATWRRDIKCDGTPLGNLIERKIHSLLCRCPNCKPDNKEQLNDDECSICKGEGVLVVCEDCPRSFHQKCHLPHIEDAMLGDDKPWICTFCIFRNTQGWYYENELKRDEALSCPISPHMLRCQYLLLYLRCVDEEQTFASDPNLFLTDYSTEVTTPMWLGKVADNLQKQLYETVGEFVSDMELIFTNCASYNRNNAEFLAMGNRLKELFEREFESVFKIRD